MQQDVIIKKKCNARYEKFPFYFFQYLSKKLGADPATFGQLQTVFAVTQLLGGPVYGRVGDLFGERLALMTAFTSAGLSYLLMGVSYTIPVLFLSRLPSAFMHVMQGNH